MTKIVPIHDDLGREKLQRENARLLNELESVYRETEELLLAMDQEREVTYQELKARNQELEARLEELAAVNRELQEAQRMLVQSERMAAMGEMASAIVHEIKNPLQVISGRVELIRMQGDRFDPKGLDTIVDNLGRLDGLTRNVLRFSRNQQRRTASTHLNQVLKTLLEFMTPVLKHVRVRLSLDLNLPPVNIDAGQLEQVLMNLMLNARDAMDGRGDLRLETGTGTIDEAMRSETGAGGICTLAVEAEEGADACRYAVVEVRDSGPGIPAEPMPRLFEAFFTTKGEDKGTGLGLSICRTIVKNLGGNILAASSPDQGASFRVFLPITSAEAERLTEKNA